MTQTHIYEGTLEEITSRYGNELAGRRLKITVEESSTDETATLFYATATPEEWSQAWREWTESHGRNTPLLSEEAISRDSIYEGRG